ncbi:hypothetical protein NMY22_g17157 [Coprinellus aureogranulatus]|nr:hypothetical protein NMY22_g17157 [Coprinellus aureogranulatus]
MSLNFFHVSRLFHFRLAVGGMQLAPFASSSPEGSSRRRRLPSSQPDMPSGGSNPSQTLPSIHHIQALIPHPPPPASDVSGGYSYAPPSGSRHSSSVGAMDGIMNPQPPHPPSHQVSQRESEYYGGVESEHDEDLGPPKKKRRRQALSCTGTDIDPLPFQSRVADFIYSSLIVSNCLAVIIHVVDDNHTMIPPFTPPFVRYSSADDADGRRVRMQTSED